MAGTAWPFISSMPKDNVEKWPVAHPLKMCGGSLFYIGVQQHRILHVQIVYLTAKRIQTPLIGAKGYNIRSKRGLPTRCILVSIRYIIAVSRNPQVGRGKV